MNCQTRRLACKGCASSGIRRTQPWLTAVAHISAGVQRISVFLEFPSTGTHAVCDSVVGVFAPNSSGVAKVTRHDWSRSHRGNAVSEVKTYETFRSTAHISWATSQGHHIVHGGIPSRQDCQSVQFNSQAALISQVRCLVSLHCPSTLELGTRGVSEPTEAMPQKSITMEHVTSFWIPRWQKKRVECVATS